MEAGNKWHELVRAGHIYDDKREDRTGCEEEGEVVEVQGREKHHSVLRAFGKKIESHAG